MKKHVKEEHLQKIRCDPCHIKFDSNIDLEIHIKTHEKPKSFNCDIFSQDFLSKMAVKKNKEGHAKNQRYCHYFNNGDTCPYEENGCMFINEVSPKCEFYASCSKNHEIEK